MKTITKKYFSPGELAKLTGISKQLLLYYDNRKIFCPDFVDERGYRFYSMSSFFRLEIIVNLRKMNIPLDEIKQFMENRSVESLTEIYNFKLNECSQKIAALEEYKKQIETQLFNLTNTDNLRLEQIMLIERQIIEPELSNCIPLSLPVKDRIFLLAKYLKPHLRSSKNYSCKIGYCANVTEFLEQKVVDSYRVFLQDQITISHKEAKTSLYVKINYYRKHNLAPQKIKTMLKAFLQKNNLIPLGTVFVFPLNNGWIASDKEFHISTIYIPVEYKTN